MNNLKMSGRRQDRKISSLDDLDEDFILLSRKNGQLQVNGRLNPWQKWPSLTSLVGAPMTNARTSFGDFVNCLRSDSPGITKMKRISETQGQVSEEPPEGLKAFISAIHDEDVEAFEKLHQDLKKSGLEFADPSMHYEDGRNVLHLALGHSGRIARYIISVSEPQFLTEAYVNFTGSTMYKTTALHMLVEQNNTDLTEKFLSQLSFVAFWKQFDFLKSLTPINIEEDRVQLMSALHVAAMKGNNTMVKMLVSCGTTVDVVNESNETPLMWAVWGNHLVTVSYLLELGASANHEDDKGSTPLYWATRYGNYDMVHHILTECKVNVNHRRKFGYFLPLALASAAGHATIVEDLLEHGARIDVKVTGGKTPLHHAAAQGHDDIIRILLKHKAKIDAVDETGHTALMFATKEGKSNCIKTLLANGADMNRKNKMGQTVWNFIVDGNGTALLKMYINIYKQVNHIQPNIEFTFCKGHTPIHIAAQKDDASKIKCLLTLNLSWKSRDDMGNTFLHTAARENSLQVLEVFTAEFNEAIQNDHGDTPLHVAVKNGHLDAVQLLLCRSSIGARNKVGSTPLHIAAWSDRDTSAIARLLVETIVACSSWSLLDAKDIKGNTALHIAAKRGRTNIIEELSALDSRVTNAEGNNPLHVAALYGGPSTMETILYVFREVPKQGVRDSKAQRFNLNQANSSGDTLLHICARQGDYDNIKIMIEDGACLSVRNVLGNTIMHDLAEQSVLSSTKIESFLKVYNVIVELSPLWWCKAKGNHVPYEDSPLLAEYQRLAMLYLTSDIHNAQGKNAIMHCVTVGATALLEAITNTPRVFKISDEHEFHFDISNFTPDTTLSKTSSLYNSRKVFHSVSMEAEDQKHLDFDCDDSVLDIISNLKNEVQATKMLDITPVRQMIKNYWTAYQLVYGFFMLVHIAYMLCYTGFGINSVDNHSHNVTVHVHIAQTYDYDIEDHPTIFPGVLLLIWPIFIVLFEIYYFASNNRRYQRNKLRSKSEHKCCSGPSLYKTCLNLPFILFSSLVDMASHISGILFSTSVFIWYGFFELSGHNQAYILSLGLLLGWMFTISFAKGFQTVHSFSIILKHIFIRDVTRFLFIYLFVMLGFALAFHVLFQLVPLLADRYHSPWDTFFMTVNVMLGLEDSLFEDFESTYSAAVIFIKITYVGYVLLSGIILFNLLIAMMTDTYANIISREGTTWKLGSVRLSLKIEHSFPFLKGIFRRVGIIQSTTWFDAKHQRWMMTIPRHDIADPNSETASDSNNANARIESRITELQSTCQNLARQMEGLMRCMEVLTEAAEPEAVATMSRRCSVATRRGSLQAAVQRWKNKAILERRLSTDQTPMSPVSLRSPQTFSVSEHSSDNSDDEDSGSQPQLPPKHLSLSQSLQTFAEKWKERRTSSSSEESLEDTQSKTDEGGQENVMFALDEDEEGDEVSTTKI